MDTSSKLSSLVTSDKLLIKNWQKFSGYAVRSVVYSLFFFSFLALSILTVTQTSKRCLLFGRFLTMTGSTALNKAQMQSPPIPCETAGAPRLFHNALFMLFINLFFPQPFFKSLLLFTHEYFPASLRGRQSNGAGEREVKKERRPRVKV